MDIIFQFGEFSGDSSFWSDLIVSFFGTGIAGGITLWVYLNQTKNARVAEETKKKQFETDRLVYFTAMIDQVIKMIEFQIEEIGEFVITVDQDPLNIPLLNIFAAHDLDRLSNKIDHAEYYHSYTNQNRTVGASFKSFDIIYSKIDYFDAQIKKMNKYLETSTQRDYDRKTDLKNSVTVINNTYDALMVKLLTNNSKREVFNELNLLAKIYGKRMAIDPSDLSIQKDQLFVPAIGIIKPFLEEPDWVHFKTTFKKLT